MQLALDDKTTQTSLPYLDFSTRKTPEIATYGSIDISAIMLQEGFAWTPTGSDS
jgi:hypothetical protein